MRFVWKKLFSCFPRRFCHFIVYHSLSCDSVTFNKKCRDALQLKCALCTWHRWTSLGLLSLFTNCAACFIDCLKALCLASKWGDWANECCCFLGVNVLWSSLSDKTHTYVYTRGGGVLDISLGGEVRPGKYQQISMIFLPCLRQNSDFWYPV